MHKRNFSLTTGACLNDDNYSIIAFDVRVDATGDISVLLPEPNDLDAVIATGKWMIKRDTARTLDCSGGLPQSAVPQSAVSQSAVSQGVVPQSTVPQSTVPPPPPPPYDAAEIVPSSRLDDGVGAGCVLSMCGDGKLEW